LPLALPRACGFSSGRPPTSRSSRSPSGDRIGPEHFLPEAERAAFLEARDYEARNLDALEKLNARERESRWRGERLSDEEVRRIGSYQRTYNEMSRGERFVQERCAAGHGSATVGRRGAAGGVVGWADLLAMSAVPRAATGWAMRTLFRAWEERE